MPWCYAARNALVRLVGRLPVDMGALSGMGALSDTAALGDRGNSLARLRADGSSRRAGVLLRRSSTKGTAAPLVLATGRTARRVPCYSHSLAKPRVQLK